jgi:hypothetical protein
MDDPKIEQRLITPEEAADLLGWSPVKITHGRGVQEQMVERYMKDIRDYRDTNPEDDEWLAAALRNAADDGTAPPELTSPRPLDWKVVEPIGYPHANTPQRVFVRVSSRLHGVPDRPDEHNGYIDLEAFNGIGWNRLHVFKYVEDGNPVFGLPVDRDREIDYERSRRIGIKLMMRYAEWLFTA